MPLTVTMDVPPRSRRVVPLAAWLADDLEKYLAEHPRRDEPEAPLFPARHGRNTRGMSRATATDPETYNWESPVEPGNLYANYFRPALAAAGIGEARLHDLRHTFATLALSAGAHYMQVSKWLGHESYVTTLTIYADYIPEDEGGKAVPVARPATAEAPAQVEELPPNVIPFRRRSAG